MNATLEEGEHSRCTSHGGRAYSGGRRGRDTPFGTLVPGTGLLTTDGVMKRVLTYIVFDNDLT